MKKSARLMVEMVVAGAAMAIAFAQVASGAAPAPVDRGGAQSVRPTTPEIRTSVGPLLGWQVGIFANVFPSLTFSESAVMADMPLTLISMPIPGIAKPSALQIVMGSLKRYLGCRLRSRKVSAALWESRLVCTKCPHFLASYLNIGGVQVFL